MYYACCLHYPDVEYTSDLLGEPTYWICLAVKTYAATDVLDVEKEMAAGREVTMVPYYEMSDGTWQIEDGHSYKYRLEVSGRMNAAESDSTFIYLSNQESIPFDQAWKASGLSSNMDDYFDEADAKFVGMK